MKTCLNCEHFANWDMDWCCTAYFRLLSEIKDNKTVNPENCTKDMSDCEYWEDDSINSIPQRTQFRREEWEYYL